MKSLKTFIRSVSTRPSRGSSVRSGGATGAALILSIASFSVVVLSISLLFGYSSRVTDGQDMLESSAQATLSHTGALESAIMRLSSGELSPGEPISPVSTGGMLTTFDVAEALPIESHTLEISMPGSTDQRAVPTWMGVLAAGRMENGFAAVLVRSGSELWEAGFPVGILLPEAPDHWIIAGNTSGAGAVAVLAAGQAGCDTLYAIGPGGSVQSYPLDGLTLKPSSVVTMGSHQGRCSAVITDGSNRAVLVDLEGAALNTWLQSPAGTCPVLAEGTGLFGEILAPGRETDEHGSPVHDVFTGDFNQDGSTDIAWAGPSTLACLLSGGELAQVDVLEGGKLLAWGFLEGRYGMGGLWEQPDGRHAWRKLLWSGFQTLPAAGTALAGYSGRLVFDGEAFFGRSSDILHVSESPLSDRTMMTFTGGRTGDYDASGGGDVAIPRSDGLTIHIDPVGREGMEFLLGVSTGLPGASPIFTETVSVRLHSGATGDESHPRIVLVSMMTAGEV